jgi:hypothetical protein
MSLLISIFIYLLQSNNQNFNLIFLLDLYIHKTAYNAKRNEFKNKSLEI